jgi:hypothetical protein
MRHPASTGAVGCRLSSGEKLHEGTKRGNFDSKREMVAKRGPGAGLDNKGMVFMRVALLTGGGDSSAINAAIRAVVRKGIAEGFEIIGMRSGWQGLIEDNVEPLYWGSVSGIIQRGGTILGTSRNNPFKVERGVERIMINLRKYGIEAIIVIGDTRGAVYPGRGSGAHR